MSRPAYGWPREIPPVPVECSGHVFENAIREFGAVNACEWFGHPMDSDLTRDTIATLIARSKAAGVMP